MKQWYAKELSKLTNVSVRTLHHYDKIGLLKPAMRLDNNYRLYSEEDLLKLQQIIALKYFGFELHQIKILLANNADIIRHFKMQAQFLQEKGEALCNASKILERITSDCSDKSIAWEKIIQSIEVYTMTEQLENSWKTKVFDQSEVQQFEAFEQNITSEDKIKFEEAWSKLIAEVEKNLSKDPESLLGIDIGRRSMALVDGFYGKENINLRTKIWREGFKKNQIAPEDALPPKVLSWLDKAMEAYWFERIYNVLALVEIKPSAIILARWKEVLEDLYGNNQEPKDAIIQRILADDKVSQAAKKWLKSIMM